MIKKYRQGRQKVLTSHNNNMTKPILFLGNFLVDKCIPMKEASSKSNEKPAFSWLSFGGLFINPLFFKRGILIVSSSDSNEEKVSELQDSFIINARKFVFHSPTATKDRASKPDSRSLKKTRRLLSSLVDFALDQQADIKPTDENSVVLFNTCRREEIFLPLSFGEQTKNLSLYLYPWVAKTQKSIHFSGFTQFVTAGCMFGASMRSITQDGDNLELINHALQLRPGQIIQSIQYDESIGNPFEQILISEFEKSCLLIKSLAKQEQPRQLIYHLPTYDYVLFGIRLFIHKQMTYEALDHFIRAILVKREDYHNKLGGLCRLHDITIEFQSPFDNVFEYVDGSNPTASILAQLQVSNLDVTADITESAPEIRLVNRCLSLLKTNTVNPGHCKVWQDFIASDPNEPASIEDLFKMANAVMIGAASNDKQDYETCSLLPLSEKQIQVQYEACRDKLKTSSSSPHYPAVLNLTTFEPVITYSPTTNGLLFYFAYCLQSLSTLITDKKIAYHAARNIGLFFQKEQQKEESDVKESLIQCPTELQTVLSDPKFQ